MLPTCPASGAGAVHGAGGGQAAIAIGSAVGCYRLSQWPVRWLAASSPSLSVETDSGPLCRATTAINSWPSPGRHRLSAWMNGPPTRLGGDLPVGPEDLDGLEPPSPGLPRYPVLYRLSYRPVVHICPLRRGGFGGTPGGTRNRLRAERRLVRLAPRAGLSERLPAVAWSPCESVPQQRGVEVFSSATIRRTVEGTDAVATARTEAGYRPACAHSWGTCPRLRLGWPRAPRGAEGAQCHKNYPRGRSHVRVLEPAARLRCRGGHECHG